MSQSAELAAMKRVLDKIMKLCEHADGNSLQGLKAPQENLEEQPEDGSELLEGESEEGDKEKLLALKRQEEEF